MGVRQRQRAALLRRRLQDPGFRGGRAARLAAARPGRHPGCLRFAADEGRQGFPGAGATSVWSTRRRTASSVRRHKAANRWRPRSARVTMSSDRCKPDTIAKSLAIGNPADGPYVLDVVPAHRRRRRVRDRRGDRCRDRAAGPDRRHLRRDRRRRHRRDPEEARGDRARSTRTWRPSSSTPATGSRRSTRLRIGWALRPRSSRRTLPSPPPACDSVIERGVTMSVNVRVPTILRTYTAGESEVVGRRRHLGRGAGLPRRQLSRASRAGSSTSRVSCVGSSTCTSATTTCGSSTGWRRASPTVPRSR